MNNSLFCWDDNEKYKSRGTNYREISYETCKNPFRNLSFNERGIYHTVSDSLSRRSQFKSAWGQRSLDAVVKCWCIFWHFGLKAQFIVDSIPSSLQVLWGYYYFRANFLKLANGLDRPFICVLFDASFRFIVSSNTGLPMIFIDCFIHSHSNSMRNHLFLHLL